MKVVRTYTVATRGIGKPDYSREVSSGISRAGIRVGYKQTLKMFARICHSLGAVSPFAWVRDQLAIGETDSAVDVDTGLEMPFSVSAGYTIDLLDRYMNCDGDMEVRVYFDSYFAVYPGVITGGMGQYIQQMHPYSSRTLDPTAASSHMADIQVTNLAAVAINCALTFICILEAVSTPPLPDIKPIKCKHCGNIDEVHYTTTSHICSKCGKLTVVLNMRDVKY